MYGRAMTVLHYQDVWYETEIADKICCCDLIRLDEPNQDTQAALGWLEKNQEESSLSDPPPPPL
jgi:hypothetical protein